MSSEFTANRRTPKGVNLKLMEGYPTINAQKGELTVVEKFLLQSEDVPTFLAECSGSTAVYANKLVVPKFPLSWPSLPTARATSVNLEPFPNTKPGDPFNYKGSWTTDDLGLRDTYSHMYAATVTYKITAESVGVTTNPPGEDDTPDVEEPDEEEPADVGAVHTVSGGAVFNTFMAEKLSYIKFTDIHGDVTRGSSTGWVLWDDAEKDAKTGKPKKLGQIQNLATPVGQIVPTIEHSIHYTKRPRPDIDILVSGLGTVNSGNESERLSYKFDRFSDAHLRPDTILFVGFTITPVVYVELDKDSDDYKKASTRYDVDLRFSEKAVDGGWNVVWSDYAQAKIMPLFIEEGESLPRKPLYSSSSFAELNKAAL